MEILSSRNGKKGLITPKVKGQKVASDLRVITTIGEGNLINTLIYFNGVWDRLSLNTNGVIYGALKDHSPCILVLADTNEHIQSFKKVKGTKGKYVKVDRFVEILTKNDLVKGEAIAADEKLVNYLSIEEVENEYVEPLKDVEYKTYKIVAGTHAPEVIKIKEISAEVKAKIASGRAKTLAAKSA